MANKMSPELKAAFSHHIRHIHLPDLAPHYAPRALPGKLRDALEQQITKQRSIAQAARASDKPPPKTRRLNPVSAMRLWLRQASPPPTVLSFTRRPTYVLPAQHMRGREPWEVEYLTAALKGVQQVAFPRPPGWSPAPYYQSWEPQGAQILLHDPLCREWEPGVLSMPCAEPMYFGPGQVSIWPVIDLEDAVQRGKKFTTKYEYERILEDTTIRVLKREYGLDAFAIPGKTGVWVESLSPPSEVADVDDLGIKLFDKTPPVRHHRTRRIATVHADFYNNITRFGVSIHVSQPARTNPWAPLRQDSMTTNIGFELALKGSVPKRSDPPLADVVHRSDKKSWYLHTECCKTSPSTLQLSPALPYSLVCLVPGLRQNVPMGLDNRDLSTAWTYEFARQLGLREGVVDHLGMVSFGPEATALPTKQQHIGFQDHRVMTEDLLKEPYQQVEVPSIQLKVEGDVTQDIVDATCGIEAKDQRLPARRQRTEDTWALSWPMYYRNLRKLLAQSIRSRSWDTRFAQVRQQQRAQANTERRWEAIEQADELREAWRLYQNPQALRTGWSAIVKAIIMDNLQDVKDLVAGLESHRSTVPRARLVRKTSFLRKLFHGLNVAGAGKPEAWPTDMCPQELEVTAGDESLESVAGATETGDAESRATASRPAPAESQGATDTRFQNWDKERWQRELDEIAKLAQEALKKASTAEAKEASELPKSRIQLGWQRPSDRKKGTKKQRRREKAREREEVLADQTSGKDAPIQLEAIGVPAHPLMSTSESIGAPAPPLTPTRSDSTQMESDSSPGDHPPQEQSSQDQATQHSTPPPSAANAPAEQPPPQQAPQDGPTQQAKPLGIPSTTNAIPFRFTPNSVSRRLAWRETVEQAILGPARPVRALVQLPPTVAQLKERRRTRGEMLAKDGHQPSGGLQWARAEESTREKTVGEKGEKGSRIM